MDAMTGKTDVSVDAVKLAPGDQWITLENYLATVNRIFRKRTEEVDQGLIRWSSASQEKARKEFLRRFRVRL